jgi:hypothetical protein
MVICMVSTLLPQTHTRLIANDSQIIEGCGSSFVGCILWFFMADYPSNTRWLTPEEQLLASQRLAYDGLGNTQGAHGRVSEKEALKMVVKDWRTWTLALLYALVTGAQTIQYFIPTLVKSFGWKDWQGQCKLPPHGPVTYSPQKELELTAIDHTIPPYACAVVFILVFCFVADHFKNKAYFISLFSGIGTIFFIVVCANSNDTVRCASHHSKLE